MQPLLLRLLQPLLLLLLLVASRTLELRTMLHAYSVDGVYTNHTINNLLLLLLLLLLLCVTR
jgi:hypothetical protein